MLEDALPARDAAVPDERRARRLAAGFVALLAATWSLIVLGALVRAHGAGLACPDWPLCFGAFVPEMNLQVGFEWGHRVLAGSISLVFVALAGLALRDPRTRRAGGGWLAVGAALLALQILLGALTVWKLLASWTVTLHLVVGNAFALALLLTACALADAGDRRPAPAAAPPRVRAAVLAVAALLALQLVLGGLVSSRFAGLACPEWPTCNGGIWFPSWRGNVGLHLLHRANGYALLVALGAAAWLARRAPGLRGVAAAAFALGLAQVLVGIANVTLGLPVEVTGLHSALATALVLTTGLAVRGAGGLLQRPRS